MLPSEASSRLMSFAGADPAEFAGAADGQQVQPDVGRRGAVRQRGRRAPAAGCRAAGGCPRGRRSARKSARCRAPAPAGSACPRRAAHAPCGRTRGRLAHQAATRRRAPEQKQEDAGPRMRLPRARPWPAPRTAATAAACWRTKAEQFIARRRLRLRRRGPFQQPAAADGHAPDASAAAASSSMSGLRRYLAELPGGRAQRASATRRARRWKKWRQAMPVRVGTRPASAPSSGPASSAAMAAKNAVPRGNAPLKITQTSRANAAGSTSERRRLSSIFQTPSASMP